MAADVRNLALASLVMLAACREPPSYRMRWSLDGQPITTATQCADAGVFDVQVRTVDVLGGERHLEVFPCFPEGWDDPDHTVDGPALSPGTYALEVRGVGRDGDAWVDGAELGRQVFEASPELDYELDARFELCRPAPPAASFVPEKVRDAYACRPEDLVCDCAELQVRDERIVRRDGFDLSRPPQCVDGLDNDDDGFVDAVDPACSIAFGDDTMEATDVATSQFDVRVSFFDGNPNVGCAAIGQAAGVSRIAIDVDGERLTSTPCRTDPIRFSSIVAAGEHVVSVHLLDGAETAVADPVSIAIDIPEAIGGVFAIEADFSADRFSQPIAGPAIYTVSFLPFDGADVRVCAPQAAREGRLEIPTIRVRVANSHGGDPTTPVRLEDGTPLDGTVDLPCPNGVSFTESLPWGGYVVTLQGVSAEGEVCFSNVGSPTPAAPYESFPVVAPRVRPIPASCRDCEEHADCGEFRCVDGECVPPCGDATDCPDGQTCMDGLCEPDGE